ncbi:hypothetical protein BASA81_004922 [Batrachochytrium salamandrivorans]|nr:hypothetical protein BASA81_004922 [Batrachochytrium salamandrivorans]
MLRSAFEDEVEEDFVAVYPEVPLAVENEEEEEIVEEEVEHEGDKVESPDAKLVAKFFTKHNPAKLATIPELLQKYTMQELNVKLEAKYGVGLFTLPPRTVAPVVVDPLKRKLQQYLARKEPSAVGIAALVESLYIQFKTNEPGLDKHLRKTYGFTLAEFGLETRLTTFLHQHDLKEERSAPKLVSRYKTEKKLNVYLFKKYKRYLQPEPPAPKATATIVVVEENNSLESKVKRFLTKFHAGISLVEVWANRLIDMYGVDELTNKLEQEYGADLLLLEPKPVAKDRLLLRLREFFSKHNPEKIDTVQAAVEKYHVDLPTLNSILRSKYRVDLNKSPSPGLDLMRAKEEGGLCEPEPADEFDLFTPSQPQPQQSAAFASTARSKLMAIFPQARVLITVRDFDSWFADHRKTEDDQDLAGVLFGRGASQPSLRQAYEDYYDLLFALAPQRILVNVYSQPHLVRVLTDTFFLSHAAAVLAAKRWAVSPMGTVMQRKLADATKPNLLALLHRSQAVAATTTVSPQLVVLRLAQRFGAFKNPARRYRGSGFGLGDGEDGGDGLQFPQEDFVGGPLINLLLRKLRASASNQFVLVLGEDGDWPRAFRGFVKAQFANGETSREWEVHAFTRLYGFYPNQTHLQSDHVLRKRRQDFVDRVHIVLAESRLLVLDLAQPNWLAFCRWLSVSEPKACASSLQTWIN